MTLHFYFARKFLWTFLGISVVFAVLLALIDLVEELQDFPELAFLEVLEIVLLNLPRANYEILPLVMHGGSTTATLIGGALGVAVMLMAGTEVSWLIETLATPEQPLPESTVTEYSPGLPTVA